VGDKIPLQATIFPQKDGSNSWTLDLVGIYHARDQKQAIQQEGLLFFNWDYFDEARQFGNGNIGWFIVRVADPKDADRVAQSIDALSFDSDHETKTQSEQAFQTAFVSQIADFGLIIGAIMGAVFFTLILLTGNTMAQAVRERIPELAVLKTIGFSNRSVLLLVLAEAVALLLIGALLGLALASLVVAGVRTQIAGFFPLSLMARETWLEGLALAVLVGLVVGALPALRGMRLRIVDALANR
jgi:putative ABC transport system permease protein